MGVNGIVLTSCEDEQAWNQDRLRDPVVRPDFRLWTYERPALILGCSQRSLLDPEQIEQQAGLGAVVRQAGGGAVLAGPWMLSTSVVLPNAHPLASNNLIQSYRWIGELYAALLRELGIAAHAIGPGEAKMLQQDTLAAGLGWACFAGFSPWEVVVGTRKIVGLAQVRRRTGILLVAGLLLERPEWALLSRAMSQPESSNAQLTARTTSCAEQLGRAPSPAQLASRLARAMQAALE